MRAEPLVPEPTPGSCANCAHRTQITLGGRIWAVCAQERDDGEPGGEVYECDPEVTDCAWWVWDGDGSDL